MPSVVVCSVHLNNDYAKKLDVAKALLEPIFKRCIGERCLCIAGDFNQAAYDKSNGSPSFADTALRAAIDKLKVWASYIRCETDCIVAFVLSYDEPVPDFEYQVSLTGSWQPDFEYQVKQTRFDDMEARDLQLFPSDKDWHAPLLLTLRPWGLNPNLRRRATESQGTRKKIKRTNYWKRKAEKASASVAASVPDEGEPPSPPSSSRFGGFVAGAMDAGSERQPRELVPVGAHGGLRPGRSRSRDDESEHRPTDAAEQADLDQTGADRRRASGSTQTDTEQASKRPRLRSPGRRTPRSKRPVTA